MPPLERHLFFTALMFYSRIPAPTNTPYSPELLNQSRKYFTSIGIIVGVIASVVFLITSILVPLSVAVLLSMIAGILATGAFHEDGFADSCDALGGGWEASQILTIMKDSRIGTYGSVGLFTTLSLKYLILYEIAQMGSLLLWCVCVINAHAVSRLQSSRQIKYYGYVQDIDKSKIKPIATEPLSESAEKFGLMIGLAPCLILAIYSWPAALLAALAAYWSANAFMRYCNKRVGGYTGDILGAIQQISELAFLLSCLAVLS